MPAGSRCPQPHRGLYPQPRQMFTSQLTAAALHLTRDRRTQLGLHPDGAHQTGAVTSSWLALYAANRRYPLSGTSLLRVSSAFVAASSLDLAATLVTSISIRALPSTGLTLYPRPGGI